MNVRQALKTARPGHKCAIVTTPAGRVLARYDSRREGKAAAQRLADATGRDYFVVSQCGTRRRGPGGKFK